MDVEGHHISGMNNQVVWGLPHVFAIFLIVAASGALNLASLASVFGKVEYKPLARFSAVLSIASVDRWTRHFAARPGTPGSFNRGDDALQLQVDIRLEHPALQRFHCHRAGLPVVDDGTPPRTLESPGGHVRFRLATDTDYRYRFDIRISWSRVRPTTRRCWHRCLSSCRLPSASPCLSCCCWPVFRLRSARARRSSHICTACASCWACSVIGILYFVILFHLTKLYGSQNHGFERFILLDGGVYTRLFWIFADRARQCAAPVAAAICPALADSPCRAWCWPARWSSRALLPNSTSSSSAGRHSR